MLILLNRKRKKRNYYYYLISLTSIHKNEEKALNVLLHKLNEYSFQSAHF